VIAIYTRGFSKIYSFYGTCEAGERTKVNTVR